MSNVINVSSAQDNSSLTERLDSRYKLYNLQKPQGKDKLDEFQSATSSAVDALTKEIASDVKRGDDVTQKTEELSALQSGATQKRGELAVRALSDIEKLTEAPPKNDPLNDARQSAAAQLRQTADKITSKFPSSLEQMTAESDNAAVSVTNVNSAIAARGDTVSVSVKQTAAAQVNEGTPMRTDALDFEEGNNTFKVNDTKFNVRVNEDDTNDTVLNKAAATVNKRDIGVNASVTRQGDTSSLSLVSANTGKDNSFTVQSNESNFVETSGADNTVTEARDASYSINDEDKTSPDNDVYIGGGISAKLKEETEKPANISTTPDTQAIKEDITDFVSSFNDMAGSSDRLKAAAAGNADNLEDIGVTNVNGKLYIDEDKLTGAIESGAAKDAFAESGFAEKVSDIAASEQAKSANDNDGSGLGLFIDVTT